jgi:hypothetical protein
LVFLTPNIFLIHSMLRELLQRKRTRRRKRKRSQRSPRSPRKARRGRKTKTNLPEAGQVQGLAEAAEAAAVAATAVAAAAAAAAAVLPSITRRDGRVLFHPQRARSQIFLQCRMDPLRKMKMLCCQSKFL